MPNQISKSDVVDSEFLDAQELASDGTTVYLVSTVVSTEAASKTVVIEHAADGTGLLSRDHPAEPGDLVVVAGDEGTLGSDGFGGAAELDAPVGQLFTIDRVLSDTSFIVVEPIGDSTGGAIQFQYAPGAKRIGVDPTGLANVGATNLQAAIVELDAAVSAIGTGETIQAGAGLVRTGDTLEVVAGDASIVVAPDSIAVGVLQSDVQHGVRGGGTQHAVATQSTAGFQSSADKTKLDSVATNAAALTGAVPQAVLKSPGSVGVGTAAARSDHRHDVSTATPVAVGTANQEGTATSLARSDHVHDHGAQTDGTLHAPASGTSAGFLSALDKTKLDGVAAGAAALTGSSPVAVTRASAVVGVASTAARADHKHDVATAGPVSIATANLEGIAVSVARSDHQHDHGAQSDGTHHAVASASVAGFLSPTDKQKLDSVSTGADVTLEALNVAGTDVSVNNQKITNLAAPTSASDAANKGYVDAAAQGLTVKSACRLLASTNVGLTGLAAVDGVTPVAGDRVLCTGQTTGSANGIYVAAAGAWSRAQDSDTSAEVTAGMYCFVTEGTKYADTGWVLATDAPIVLGTTPLVFVQFSGAGSVEAGDGLTRVGNTLAVGANADGSIAVSADDIRVGVLATDAQHGNRGGGALHANATTGAAGFLSAADKTRLDSMQDSAAALTSAAPIDVTKTTSVVGVATKAARADHKHDVSTAVGVGLNPGAVSQEGTATSLARSDHVHALPAFGSVAGTFAEGNDVRLSDARTPTAHAATHLSTGSDPIANASGSNAGLMSASDYTKLTGIAAGAAALTNTAPLNVPRSASAGVATTAARADHQHDAWTGPPVGLAPGGGNVMGSSSSLARADHIHALPAFGNAAGTFTEGNDPRLSAPRAPTSHAGTHQDGGTDEISVTGLSGVLADSQKHTIALSGFDVGTRTRLSLSSAGVVSLTVTDNSGLDQVDATIGVSAAAPADLVAGGPVVGGVSAAVSRADHVHALPAAAPSGLVVGGGNVAGTSPSVARADHQHALPQFGTTPGTITQGDDPRLSDARMPTSHGSTHAPGGADPLATGTPVALVVGGSNQPGTQPSFARSDHQHSLPPFGSAPGTLTEGNDPRLSNARVPTDHSTSHEDGGPDEINVQGLSGVLADPQLAGGLKSASTIVSVADAVAPLAGQSLVATGPNSATWQTVEALQAGAGLTRTGTTLDVVASDGSIVVGADSIGVGVLQTDAQHGVRGGGDQHAAATTGMAGFLSAIDKTKLDTIADSAAALTSMQPVSVTRAPAVLGVASTAARADHKHDVATATPVAIGTANLEGTAGSLARSDHTHDHGVQTSGTLHAVATQAVAGFQSAADKLKLDSVAVAADVTLAALGTASTDVSVNNQRITNVATPTSASDAATRAYVDAAIEGLDVKQACRLLRDTNHPLNGLSGTTDGIKPVAGDRILLINQTSPKNNGIYIAAAGAWSRASDADQNAEVTSGMYTFILEGTVYQDTGWILTSPDPITLGTSDLVFAQFSSVGAVAAGDGLTRVGQTLNVTPAVDGSIAVSADDIGVGVLATDAQHGVRGGGSQHAVATQSAAGFQSVADKTKLDGIADAAAALTSAAPADVSRAVAQVGVATFAARADHKHDVSTAAAVALAPGSVNTEGSATSLARSDHSHELPRFGDQSGMFVEGIDARLSDDRTTSGLRTATTIVDVSGAAAPASGYVLTASNGSEATWKSPTADALATSGADVAVGAAAPPVVGQALVATSPTTATWQDVSTVQLSGSGPAVVDAGAPTVGAATVAARGDHKHSVATAAPLALAVGGPNNAGSATSLARADHAHALPPFGNTTGTFAEGSDPRLNDSRVPKPHAVSHRVGGTDELLVTGLHGLLADPQTAGGLQTATTIVNVSSAAAPSAGMTLIATSSTTASWQPYEITQAGTGLAKTGATLDIVATDPSIVVSADSIGVGVLQTDAQHGQRGGGAQHATATTTDAGFLSASDKAKLDSVAASAAALSNTAPSAVTRTAADAGVAATAARADHKHDVTTAGPVSIGTSNVEGIAASLARSDHVHDHGIQSLGTLHAVATPSAAGFQSAADKVKLDGISSGADVTFAALGGATTSVSVNNQRITNVATPTSASDAASKAYVDAAAQGLSVKAPCRLLASANVALSGIGIIDDVTPSAGDRVLCVGQSVQSANGIYVVAAGAWSRAPDADVSAEVMAGMYTFVTEGTAYADTGWVLATDNPIVLGSTSLSFVQFSGAATVVAGDGLTKNGNTLAVGANADGSIVVSADDVRVGVLASDAQHGVRGGGTQHALATAGAAGFLSAPDKVKLDGVAASAAALTSVAPENVTSGAASVGVATLAARADHKHDVSTAAAVALVPGSVNDAGTAASLARSDHTHGLPPFGSSAGTFTQGNDPRLSNARLPTAHAASHQDGGADEIVVTGLTGQLADPQKSTIATAGTDVGTRSTHNFIGTGLAAVSAADNAGAGRVDITVSVPVGAPAPLSAGGTAVTGISASAAASDHVHALAAGTPVGLSVGGSNGAGSSSSVARADHVHALPNFGSVGGTIAQGNDPRFTDARVPIAHNASHENGGLDEINVTGLSGVLADPQVASGLKSATGVVSVSAATAPSVGQTLVATSPTSATWQAYEIVTAGGGLTKTGSVLDIAATDPSIVIGPDSIGVGVLQSDAQHGLRGGGTQHAIATTGTAGFLSALDKTKLDSVASSAAALTGADPVSVTKSPAVLGVASTAARADHKHDVLTAAPVTIGTANAEGSAVSLARSDHTHDHGAQTLGSLHAVATQTVAGFQSAADKVKLDSVAPGADVTLSALNVATTSVSVNNQRVTNVATPTAGNDAANKAYVDAAAQGLEVKTACRLLATTNQGLAGLGAIDSVVPANGNRILCIGQTTASANGIYVASSGAWSRAQDADTSAEVMSGMYCFVTEGGQHADTGWILTTDDPITLGTTSLAFAQFSGAGTVIAGDGLTRTGNTLAVSANVDGSIAVSANGVGVGVLATDAQHGNRGGGAQHAVATTGSAGFLSSQDKTKLDSVAASAAALSGAAPSDVTSAVANAGVAALAARADHKHDVSVAAAVGLTPGGSNSAGSASSLARSDHTHALPPFGNSAGTITAGNDARLSDDRAASAIRSATTLVSVSGAAAPLSGQVLTAVTGTVATWQSVAIGSTAETLGTSGADVAIGAAAPPTAGQALIATSATTAVWADVSSLQLTGAAPVAVDAGSPSLGVATVAATGDHKHSVATAAPSALTVGGANSAGVSNNLARADHVHGLPPFGSGPGTFVEGNDTRLSNSRAPTSHAASHQDGGVDEIVVTGLSGLLADPQTAGGLKSATTIVSVSAAAAPSAGQALVATSPSTATWQPVEILSAGAGLTKTGTIFDVVAADASIVVGADSIGVGVLQTDAQHGTRGGGTQHALATTGVAGFLSALDKTKLDSVASSAAALTGTDPVPVTKSAAVLGVATTAARADHKHDVATAGPVSIGTTNAEGTAASLARSDHTHDHGVQTLGTLHAVATSSAAGFQSAADKVKLDGVAAGADVTLGALSSAAGSISVNNQKVTNLATPTAANDAANKAYVDATAQGLSVKQACRLLSSTNIALSGLATIDGVTPAGNDRILVIGQTTQSQNGIYVAASGAWSRATDADASSEVLPGMFAFVTEGTANADTGWVLTTDGPIVLGTTPLVFAQFSGTGSIVAGAGLTKSGNTLDVGANADGSIVVSADDIRVGVLASDAQHGTRGGGALHAAATTGSAGFLSALDKTKLDGIAASAAALTSAAPVNVTSGAASVGISTLAAREDHKHDITVAAPTGTLVPGGVNSVGAAASLARSDHTHAMNSFGTTANTFCQGNDARLSDTRTPTAHKASHQDGGVDEIDVTGLSGLLADAQKNTVAAAGSDVGTRPKQNFIGTGLAAVSALDNAGANRVDVTIAVPVGAPASLVAGGSAVTGIATTAAASDHVHALPAAVAPTGLTVGGSNVLGSSGSVARADHVHSLPAFGSTVGTIAQGNDSRFTDARTPTAHKISHQDGGIDEIDVTGLSGLLADPQTAGGLKSAGGIVNVSSAAAPSAGQTLVATSATAATWQQPLQLTSTAPADVTSAAAVLGISTTAARSDHKHDISVAAPVALTIGGANAIGSATSLSRSDHTHQLPAFGTTVGTIAQGSDARFTDARTPTAHASTHLPNGSDPLTTAAPLGTLAVSGSNLLGTANTFARSDHMHAMPGLVSGSVDGFMSVGLYNKLSGIASGADVTLTALANAGADVSVNNKKITGLATPTLATDAATKGYVDASAQGLSVKQACRLIATTNITLSGLAAIDSVTPVANDRILVAGQTTQSQNGIYVAASGAWSRSADADISAEVVSGMFCFVTEGTVYADTGWVLTTNDPITLGTTGLAFAQFSGAGSILAGAGLTKTGSQLDVVAADSTIVVAADSIRVGTVDATQVATAGPSALVVAGANVTGTASTLARSDHVHALSAGVLPASLIAGSSPLEGTSTSVARADHQHVIASSVAPTALTVGGSAVLGTSSSLARADHVHALPAFGSGVGTFCQGSDARLSDARTPTAHASTHAPGQADAIATGTPVALTVGGSNAPGTATTLVRSDHTHALPAFGTTAGTFAQGNDARFGAVHASSHQDGGIDEINVTGLSGQLADAQNVAVSAAGLARGVRPLLNFLSMGLASVSGTDNGTSKSIDLIISTPPFGTSGGQICQGNDSRLSDDRTASGLRTAAQTVAVSSASPPEKDMILTADTTASAVWAYPAAATKLAYSGGTLDVSAAGTPLSGQVLTCVSNGGPANWQNPVILSSGAPSNVLPQTASGGVAVNAARSDHKHDVTVAAPTGTLTPGGANASGSAASLARSDHTHALPAFGTGAGTFAQGNDTRLYDDRTASGLRTSSTIVTVSGATAPTATQVLTATGGANATWQTPISSPSINGFRLSGSATAPVNNVTNPTTIYMVEYTGNQIGLYVSSIGRWVIVTPAAQPSLSLSGRTSNGYCYDVFAYSNDGSNVAMEVLQWSTANTRASNLVRSNGVWVKQGDTTRRYVGTIRDGGGSCFAWSTKTGSDSASSQMGLWNVDNRVQIAMEWAHATNWTVTPLNQWVRWRGSSGQYAGFEYVIGNPTGTPLDIVHIDISAPFWFPTGGGNTTIAVSTDGNFGLTSACVRGYINPPVSTTWTLHAHVIWNPPNIGYNIQQPIVMTSNTNPELQVGTAQGGKAGMIGYVWG